MTSGGGPVPAASTSRVLVAFAWWAFRWSGIVHLAQCFLWCGSRVNPSIQSSPHSAHCGETISVIYRFVTSPQRFCSCVTKQKHASPILKYETLMAISTHNPLRRVAHCNSLNRPQPCEKWSGASVTRTNQQILCRFCVLGYSTSS